MSVLVQLAILVATTLIQRALAPKVRNPMPALEDFQVPTAEYGRPIPWLFGTRKIKDPNIIWYGDLDRHVKTKDGAKYYTYYMGLHMEICIGPVDVVYRIWYGDKVCWEGEQTASGLIQIEQPGLYGGRYKEGGIDGSFNLLFGEAGQGVNNYLEAQIGLPLSAFRDSFCIVGRKPALTANSTYIKPLLPLVKRIKKGWPDDSCWYPETAEIPEAAGSGTSAADEVLALIQALSPAILLVFDDAVIADGETCTNTGSSAEQGLYMDAIAAAPPIEGVTDYAVDFSAHGQIRFAPSSDYNYFDHDQISLGFIIETKSNFGEPPDDSHYLFHHGDRDELGDQGVSVELANKRDGVTLQYFNGGWRAVTVAFDAPIGSLETLLLGVVISRTGGDNETGYLRVYKNCVLQGTTSFPAASVPGTAYDLIFGACQTGPSYSLHLKKSTVGVAFLCTAEVNLTAWAEIAGAAGFCASIDDGLDMNPVHIIYNTWVDTHQGMAEDPASIDDTAMRYAAGLCYDERLGLSMYWARQSSIEDFVGEVCRHAGLLQTINPRTGQLKIVALRDDYDVSSLDTLTEDDVIEVVEWQDAADGEAVNTITVRWVDRAGADQATTYTNRASVQQHGVIAETRDYPGIAREDLARRVAKRDVKESSSNLAKGKLKINRQGWDKFPGDVFIFSHAPEGIEELVLRVLEIDTGTLTDGAITLTVVQDIFSLPLDVPEISEQGSEWVAPTTDPVEATTATLMELPYWALLDVLGVAETGTLDDGAGYIAALAAKPSPLTTDIDIWARISPAIYAEVRPEQACAPSATLVAALDRATDTDIDLDDLSQLEEVEAGWLVQIGTGALAELCRVTAIDVDLATVSVDRAILDTTPQEHAGGAPLFFLPDSASDWARDPTQYADGDTVDVKLQPGTASGELDVDSITAVDITMASRHVRPYPPGNILLEGSGEIYSPEPWPDRLLDTITVTWAHRDRVDQGATIVVQDDATDYGPESGTTYSVYLYNDETGDLLASQTGISGTTADIDTTETENHTARIEIASVRDGYECWQRQVRRFEHVPNGLLSDNDASPLATDGTGTVITRG